MSRVIGGYIGYNQGGLVGVTLAGGSLPSTIQGSMVVSGDDDFNNVALLLHCDGADGGTAFVDNGPRQHFVNVVGTAIASRTAQKKFGTASAGGSVNGTGDYLSVPDHPSLNFGSGDFTIECFARWNATNVTNFSPVFVGKRVGSANYGYVFAYFGNALYLNVTNNGSSITSLSASFTPSTGQWYHIAVTRAAGSVRFFVNGTQVGTTQTYSGYICDSNSVLTVISDGANLCKFDGYVDELRISRVARFTANFTPTTSAYPNLATVTLSPITLTITGSS